MLNTITYVIEIAAGLGVLLLLARTIRSERAAR